MMACKKDVEPAGGLSPKIQNIVSKAALDDMKAKGLLIHEGTQPPNIEGIFESSPQRLLSPYGPADPFQKGRINSNYKFRFYQQQGDVVQVDYRNASGSETGTGQGAFLAGSGNAFSLFLESSGTSGGTPYKAVQVLTGEMTASGIRNFQFAVTLTQKTGDESNVKLIPVHQARVWEDGDQLAQKVSTF